MRWGVLLVCLVLVGCAPPPGGYARRPMAYLPPPPMQPLQYAPVQLGPRSVTHCQPMLGGMSCSTY